MLIGLDVYHGTLSGKRSVAGFVASMDSGFTQFWSASMILGVGQELAHSVASNVGAALNEYAKVNKFYPDTIIFYRDGVGESQVSSVEEVETNSIVEIINKMSPQT